MGTKVYGSDALTTREAKLEKQFIETFLGGAGHTLTSIDQLVLEERQHLMAAACTYASLHLEEIKDKAHLAEVFCGLHIEV